MYGTIKVGVNSENERELEIIDFIQAKFIDGRIVAISHVEDGSFAASVFNPTDSGRSEQSTIWLSKESLIGLLSTCINYFNIQGEDLGKLIYDISNGGTLGLNYSDNLKDKIDQACA